MPSGQMFLAIAAFMLFGLVNINMQRTTLESAMRMDSNTYIQQAVSIARAMSDEIQQKKFDQVCLTKIIVRLSDLTAIGPGATEKYPYFTDVDDFSGSVFTSPTSGSESGSSSRPKCLENTSGFTVRVTVQYVNPASPETVTSSKTFAKRVTITVSNAFAKYSLTSSFVVTY